MKNKWHKKSLVLAVVSTSFLFLFHPFMLLPLGSVLLAFALYYFKKTKSIVLFQSLGLLLLTGLVYYLLLGRQILANQSLNGISNQIQSSPPFFNLILSWGLFAPLLILSFKNPKPAIGITFLRFWLIIQLACVYLPISYQKLFLKNLWVPVALLGFIGLKQFLVSKNSYAKRFILPVLAAPFSD